MVKEFRPAMMHKSMHRGTKPSLAMTHESMHALEARIHNLDRKLSLYPIGKFTHALLHADKKMIVDHQARAANDRNSSSTYILKVNGVKRQHTNEKWASKVSMSAILYV